MSCIYILFVLWFDFILDYSWVVESGGVSFESGKFYFVFNFVLVVKFEGDY